MARASRQAQATPPRRPPFDLRYQGRINALLNERGVRTEGPVLTPDELEAMTDAYYAGISPEEFAARIPPR